MTNEYIIQLTDIWAKTPATPQDRKKPKNAKIAHGFDYGEKPSHATFNWMLNKVMMSSVALQQNGILPWDDTTSYYDGAIVRHGASNFVWQSLKGDPTDPANQNIGRDPETATTYWKKGIEDSTGYLKKLGNNHPSDVTGGEMNGVFIVKSGAKLVIEA